MKAKGIITITILALLAVPITLCAWGFLLPAVYSETFMGELPLKVRLLDETEGPRIIILGGSAAAFGVDSDYLGSELDGYNAVNFGMYAGLGTRAMMDLSAGSLRRGDIVVVMPEQQAQSLSDYFGAEYFWQAADGHFGLLSKLSRDEAGDAVAGFPAFAAGKCSYVIQKTQPEPDAVYRKSIFTENGNIRPGVAVENRMPGDCDTNTPIIFDEEIVSPEFAEILNGFSEMAERRGAAVYYHFPPMNGKAAAVDADTEAPRFADYLTRIFTCRVLGDPRDSIMDSRYFFDTNFHLNDEGREIFTRQLVRDIKAELGDFSKTVGETGGNAGASDTESATPEYTESSGSLDSEIPTPTDESSPHEARDDLFVYIIEDGTAALLCLTEEGKKQTSVSVPSEIDDHPVEIIRTSAFAGYSELLSIRIPACVRMIEDGAFSECEKLREIVMDSSCPEECIVGKRLLAGTDAKILVPPDALTAYRLNYNWSVWADRIMPYDRT